MSDAAASQRPVLVLNAGGQSRRMGRSKALLPVPPTGRPLLEHMVRRLLPLEPLRLLVVSNDAGIAAQANLPLPAAFVADAWPDTGTLGGIATALAHLAPNEGWAVVLACDLPLVRADLLASLLALADDSWDCVLPVVGGYEEPLHALYHRRCLPAIESRLRAGERRVISFLPDVRTRRVAEADLRAVDPDLRSFVNANTPEDWAAALALLAAEQADGSPAPPT